MNNTHRTRESWLLAVAKSIEPLFEELGHIVPAYRLSIGFTGQGKRGNAVAETWSDLSSKDHHHEIFIRPDEDDPITIANHVVHEMTHVVAGVKNRHGPVFAQIARKLGLVGNLSGAHMGARLRARIAPLVEAQGPIPHAALDFQHSTQARKRKTHLLKAHCSECGYTVRVTAQWVKKLGPPLCPAHAKMICNLPESDTSESQAPS